VKEYRKRFGVKMRRETKKLRQEKTREALKKSRSKWRDQSAVQRIENPSNPKRAKQQGYKDKQGVVMARARVPRGGRKKKRPKKGRRAKRMGVNKLTPEKSKKVISEERTAKKFPNLEVLNSYKVGEDGMYHYFEIIMVDPDHPSIENDEELNWTSDSSNTGRVYRGLTSAAKSSRGLTTKGEGSEKIRPSKRSASRQ